MQLRKVDPRPWTLDPRPETLRLFSTQNPYHSPPPRFARSEVDDMVTDESIVTASCKLQVRTCGPGSRVQGPGSRVQGPGSR
eukprot:1102714-Rhodomonas_salina.1